MVIIFEDKEAIETSFDGVSVSLHPLENNKNVRISVEIRQGGADFANGITCDITLSVPGFELRESRTSLNGSDNDSLTAIYNRILEESVAFEFRAAEKTLTSNGTLLALAVQIVTDAVDAQLEESIAATRRGAPSSSQLLSPNKSGMPRRSTSNSHSNSSDVVDTEIALLRSGGEMSLTFRIAKIENLLASASGYEKKIASEVLNSACVGATLICDPLSDRRLLCLVSRAAVGEGECDAGVDVLKALRTQVADVDSRGRKCYERCISDLGSYTAVISGKLLFSSAPETLRAGEMVRVTPATREDGVVLLKSTFVAPMVDYAKQQYRLSGNLAQAQSEIPVWLKTALQIIDNPDLFKHI